MLFRFFHRQTGVASLSEEHVVIEKAPPAYKTYLRFPKVALPAPLPLTTPLAEALSARESAECYDDTKALTLNEIATLAHYGAGLRAGAPQHAPRRHYPSGGGLYPVECYLALFRVEGIESGLYHVDVSERSLARLPFPEAAQEVRSASEGLIPSLNPAAILVFTAVWGRSYPKYGEFAYRLALAEAGHAAQNVLLAAAALGVGARPIMGFRDERIMRALDIEHDGEDPLYLVYLGRA